MRVLVLDGNENQAVAAVRSLARAGHHVVAGADTSWSKAGWSRACAEYIQYPAPEQDGAAFVDAIIKELARGGAALVLPMTERTTLPISASRAVIAAAGGRLVLPSHAAVVRAFDKEQTTALATKLGIQVPETVTVSSEADAARCADRLRYPVVLKPRCSFEEAKAGLRATGAPVYARDADEFLRRWADLRSRCRSAVVQDYVEGTGVGYFALMRHGEPAAEFAHQRLRDVRPAGSGSSLRVSVPPDRRIREASLAILRSLGWHGVAMVEFRLRSDGTPVFLEVNGRFWNSLALAIAAGVDFPALIALLAADRAIPLLPPYRVGVRCRWMLGDFRHLVEVWRGAPSGFPGTFPARFRTLAAVLRPVRGTCHDNFSWRDPLPELGDWINFALRTIPRKTMPKNLAEVSHASGRSTYP